MMQTITLLPISLILFDGGDGGTGGAGIGQAGASDAGMQTGGAMEAGEALDAGEKETPEERKARYKAARQEFKDLFDSDTQRMLDRRFKETKGLQDQLDAVRPVMDVLFSRYRVEYGDMDALSTAIEEDRTFWADAAEERGLTVEQYKEMIRLESQVGALKAEQEAQRQAEENARAQAFADQTEARWREEERQLKQIYPGFSLDAAILNPEFYDMLTARTRSGRPLSVRAAFESVFSQEIMDGVAATTAKAAEKQITANIRARGARPAEGGKKGAIGSKIDVSKLDKKGRAELIARAARGERIEL